MALVADRVADVRSDFITATKPDVVICDTFAGRKALRCDIHDLDPPDLLFARFVPVRDVLEC